MFMCVCVCERERERERARWTSNECSGGNKTQKIDTGEGARNKDIVEEKGKQERKREEREREDMEIFE